MTGKEATRASTPTRCGHRAASAGVLKGEVKTSSPRRDAAVPRHRDKGRHAPAIERNTTIHKRSEVFTPPTTTSRRSRSRAPGRA